MSPARSLRVLVVLGLAASCTCTGGEQRPRPAAEGERTIALLDQPTVELQIPDDNRPGHAAPPDQIPLEGPWRYAGSTKAGMHKYVTPLPIRPRGLFFHRAQPGMKLVREDGSEVRYDRFGKHAESMWAHDRRELIVYAPERGTPPAPGAYTLKYPKATEREATLNLRWSDKSADAFVATTIQDDWDSRRGLLLPAPGVVAWDIEVPPSAELSFVAGLVEPEIRQGDPSDGAKLTAEIEVNGVVHPLLTAELAIRAFERRRADLTPWAGKHVRLRIHSDPLGTPDYDYVFLAEPVVATRQADPTRVVMIFVDTLRPDHLSLYGYERDTTAAIDHLKTSSAIFTQARTVAPWTLPSARTIVTGRHPEFYDRTETLPETLRKQGFATAFFAGNVYLSANFEMHRDWEFHRVGLWPLAEETTDDALRWLEQHEGRDALLQVHYMSTHLPYIEPPSYRSRYAGEGPEGLRDEFHLSDVRKAKLDADPEGQAYVQDRYDNNIRYATDQIQRILDVLDEGDIVLLYADHGEEFWDHSGFEHGHTLYEELLRVPLVVRAPGVRAASIDVPVSLLDLTPTVLDLLGQPVPPGLDGASLAPLLRGEPGADAPFRTRDLAFGRPLYGSERWGVLGPGATPGDPVKWTTHEGKEALFDLAKDPEEKKNLLKKDATVAGAPYRARLGTALGRGVSEGWRLVPSNHRGGKDAPGLWTLCTVPGGFEHAFKADDPLENSLATVRLLTERAEIDELRAAYGFRDKLPDDVGAAEVCWHAGWAGSREVYLASARPAAEVGHALRCEAFNGNAAGGKSGTLVIPPDRDPALSDLRTSLGRAALDGRTLSLEFGISPVPTAETQALQGRDPEANEMLEAMGYVDPDKPTATPHDPRPAPTTPCEPPAAQVP